MYGEGVIKLKFSRELNIKEKLAWVVVVAVVLSLVGYNVSLNATENWINKKIYTNTYLQEVEKNKLSQLEKYIKNEGIEIQRISAIDKWQKQNPDAVLNIFAGDRLIYDTWNDYKYDTGYTYGDLIKLGYDSKKTIEFSDGRAIVFLNCWKNEVLESIIEGVALIFWCLACVMMVIVGMNRNIKEYRKIDMLSHDLKTPLSAIMLYADLIKMNSVKDSDEEKYAIVIEEKAYQMRNTIENILHLKKMYKIEKQWISGDVFFLLLNRQLITELQEQGFELKVEYDKCEIRDKKVLIDGNLNKILYNNILINMISYADRTEPIRIYLKTKGRFIYISIENKISNRMKGTGLGEIICKDTMRGMKGCYRSDTRGDNYITELFYDTKQVGGEKVDT